MIDYSMHMTPAERLRLREKFRAIHNDHLDKAWMDDTPTEHARLHYIAALDLRPRIAELNVLIESDEADGEPRCSGDKSGAGCADCR